MTSYKWRTGTQTAGIDADIAGKELRRLHDKHKGLTAKIVLSDAKRSTSPLHDYFTWDNKKAGEAFRKHQARNLVRSIKIEVTGKAPASEYTRVIEIKEDGSKDKKYKLTEIVVQSKTEFESAVTLLATKLSGAQRALDELREFATDTGDKDLALIAIAAQALATAHDAVNTLVS